jgi:hypothetical protein
VIGEVNLIKHDIYRPELYINIHLKMKGRRVKYVFSMGKYQWKGGVGTRR